MYNRNNLNKKSEIVRKPRYSMRKLSIGFVSCMLGVTILFGGVSVLNTGLNVESVVMAEDDSRSSNEVIDFSEVDEDKEPPVFYYFGAKSKDEAVLTRGKDLVGNNYLRLKAETVPVKESEEFSPFGLAARISGITKIQNQQTYFTFGDAKVYSNTNYTLEFAFKDKQGIYVTALSGLKNTNDAINTSMPRKITNVLKNKSKTVTRNNKIFDDNKGFSTNTSDKDIGWAKNVDTKLLYEFTTSNNAQNYQKGFNTSDSEEGTVTAMFNIKHQNVRTDIDVDVYYIKLQAATPKLLANKKEIELPLSSIKGKTLKNVIENIEKNKFDTFLKNDVVKDEANNNNPVPANINNEKSSSELEKNIAKADESFTLSFDAKKWGQSLEGTFTVKIVDDSNIKAPEVDKNLPFEDFVKNDGKNVTYIENGLKNTTTNVKVTPTKDGSLPILSVVGSSNESALEIPRKVFDNTNYYVQFSYKEKGTNSRVGLKNVAKLIDGSGTQKTKGNLEVYEQGKNTSGYKFIEYQITTKKGQSKYQEDYFWDDSKKSIKKEDKRSSQLKYYGYINQGQDGSNAKLNLDIVYARLVPFTPKLEDKEKLVTLKLSEIKGKMISEILNEKKSVIEDLLRLSAIDKNNNDNPVPLPYEAFEYQNTDVLEKVINSDSITDEAIKGTKSNRFKLKANTEKWGIALKDGKVEFEIENDLEHATTITEAKENTKLVKGTGKDGDYVVIQDAKGKKLSEPVKIENGTFEAHLTGDPLKEGEVIKAVPVTDKGENLPEVNEKSIGTYKVEVDPKSHRAELSPIKEGETSVFVKGMPGDKIRVEKNGELIQEVEIKDNNKVEVKLPEDKKIKAGDVVTATPLVKVGESEELQEGTPNSETAEFDKDGHKPTIISVPEGAKEVTVTGKAGDTIKLTRNGEDLGEAVVGTNGEAKIELKDKELKSGDKLVATPVVETANGKEKATPSDPVDVSYKQDNHKLEVEKPIQEGDTSVTVKGIPGDEVEVKGPNGEILGKGKIGDNGTVEIPLDQKELSKLKASDKISFTPFTTVGKDRHEGIKLENDLKLNPSSHEIKLSDPIKEGAKTITGTGKPGDKVEVKIGNKVVGTVDVNEQGKFTYNHDENKDGPITKDSVIELTPEVGNQKLEDKKLTPKVDFDSEYHKVKLEEPKDGDNKVIVTGKKGDLVKITDKFGKVIGQATIDKDDEKQVINLDKDRVLKSGEEIKATPFVDEKEGTSDTKNVDFDKDLHTASITGPVKEGQKEIEVTGKEGDVVKLTNGKEELGKVTIGPKGKAKIVLSKEKELKSGETLIATPVTTVGDKEQEGIPSDPIKVEYNEDNHNVALENPIKEGDKLATVKGNPGDKVKVMGPENKVIGEGTIGMDGKADIPLNEDVLKTLSPEDTITLIPTTEFDGKVETGKSTNSDLKFDPSVHKIAIDQPVKEGSKTITGTGKPGDKVEVKIGDKVVGTVDVNDQGKFTYNHDENKDGPITKDSNIVLTSFVEVKTAGINDPKVYRAISEKPNVVFDKDFHKTELSEPKDGDDKVVVTGKKGDIVKITDPSGELIGQTTIIEDDEPQEIKLQNGRTLKPGEEITATPYTQVDGKEEKGNPSSKSVKFDPESHKVTIEKPLKEGQDQVIVKGREGDLVKLTDKDGQELGKAKIGPLGEETIELPEGKQLKEGEEITATPYTQVDDKEEKGTESTEKVVFNADNHKPKIDHAKIGENVVKGKGIPGDKITVTGENGEELVKDVPVNEDGKFEAQLNRPLKEGETITVTPTVPAKDDREETKAPSAEATVIYIAEEHKVTLDPITEGDKTVKGKGKKGDVVVLTDDKGNEVAKGTITREDGMFEIKIPENRPLKNNEEIKATPYTEKTEGPSDTKEVQYDGKNHKPELNELKEGQSKVEGKGKPGDKIELKDKSGNKLGEVFVNPEGKFSIDLDNLLEKGQELVATPITDGKSGTSAEAKVAY
ncbi:Ig-like domain-containing protein, partial [Helcococcus ovis]|uniref:Ig-like domain-containing protein n=1 Tax=Helcococcus ovis TaxID=72026 RepID=UPI0038B93ED7